MSAPGTHVRHAPRTAASKNRIAAVDSLMLAERTRWAMRIHEGLTQSITSAVLELQTLRARIAHDPNDAIAALAAVEAEIRKDLGEVRAILFELDEGEPPRAPSLARFVKDIVERWKLPARVVVSGDVDHVPAAVQEVAHGILAEALANAAKHSGSPEVGVRVRAEAGELRIEVEDSGAGIAGGLDDPDEDPHFGLRLMRMRVEKIGGSLELESNPGNGTRVIACLPFGKVKDE